MGAFYDEIPDFVIDWIKKQHLFFVSTSGTPPCPEKIKHDGYPNLSPKDMKSFEVVNNKKVWYQDLTGSGVETIAFLQQNGGKGNKMTIMFVAFEGPPRILRLFGTGTVHERTTPSFEEILPSSDPRLRAGCRAIIELNIEKVGSSCGFSIPFFSYVSERPTLDEWARKKILKDLDLPPTSTDSDLDQSNPNAQEQLLNEIIVNGEDPKDGGMRKYWEEKNSRSREGLPALKVIVPPSPTNAESTNGDGKKDTVIVDGGEKFYSASHVRELILQERRKFQSDWSSDALMYLCCIVLGVAIGFSCAEFLRERLTKLIEVGGG